MPAPTYQPALVPDALPEPIAPTTVEVAFHAQLREGAAAVTHR